MGRHLARLPSATLPSPQYVLMERSAATWDHTQTVGWEMCACQETLCVLHPVTPPPPPSARLERSCVTWGPLLRAAGWEITVWNSPPPSQCGSTEISCDVGTHDGCWLGDFCM